MTSSKEELVFLVGAGFAKHVNAQMPLTTELGDLVRESMGSALPEVVQTFGSDFERWLSYLSAPYPWVKPADDLKFRGAALDVIAELARILKERQTATMADAVPAWLTQAVRYWHEHQSTVLCFNYDAIIEATYVGEHSASWRDVYGVPTTPIAMREAGVVGGSPAESLTLLKLHGSLNWYHPGPDSGTSDIYDVGVSAWADLGLPRYEGAERMASGLVPLLVPPLAAKSPYLSPPLIREQWTQAASALSRAETLVVIGYSLPITDMAVRDLLATTFDGTTVIPIDPDSRVAARFEELFGDRVIDDFTGHEDAINRFVRHRLMTS